MKKIVIALVIIAVVGAVFIRQYDKMLNTVADILDKYSVETVLDGEIVTRNFLIKYATPFDIVRSYAIITIKGENAFLEELIAKRQAEVEGDDKTLGKIRIVTRVPDLNEIDEPLKIDWGRDSIKNGLKKVYDYPDIYYIHTHNVDISEAFLSETSEHYEKGDWAAIFAYIRAEIDNFSISSK